MTLDYLQTAVISGAGKETETALQTSQGICNSNLHRFLLGTHHTTQKTSQKFVNNFSSYPANRQAEKCSVSSLAEVNMIRKC